MNIYILISLLSSLFSNYIFILPYHNINYNHAYIKKGYKNNKNYKIFSNKDNQTTKP